MSGKDLLAMIVPSLILTAAIAFALGVSDSEKVSEGPDAGQDASMRVKAQTATQKRMRDPWEKPVYAKTSSAPRAVRYDESRSNQETPYFYW